MCMCMHMHMCMCMCMCMCIPQVDLVRKLTDEFSEGDTHANSIAWLIAFTMGFEVEIVRV